MRLLALALILVCSSGLHAGGDAGCVPGRGDAGAVGDYIDAPLAMKAGQGASAQTYFVHANSLYSPQAVTNEAGQVVERYSYTAYGERTVLGGYSSSTSRIGFNHGFTGLRDDGGLLFARNRYFSPGLGRWTSRDPAGYIDGYSLYAGYFVPNGVDPTGMVTECPEDMAQWPGEEMESVAEEYLSYFGRAPSVYAASVRAHLMMGYSVADAAAISLQVERYSANTNKYSMTLPRFCDQPEKHIRADRVFP